MTLLGVSEEDLWMFTSETSNGKAKSSENFLSPDQKWRWYSGAGCQVVQKLSVFTPKGTSLPESASFKPFCVTISWGVWPPGVLTKKKQKVAQPPIGMMYRR